MKVLISHIYNEEYLLPWWLKHHREYFDHGIIIDYASTDSSLDIVRELCPSWEIVQSRNSEFGAEVVDREVMEYESKYQSGIWRIALNTTEFLVGNYSILLNSAPPIQHLVPCFYFVDEFELRSGHTIDRDKPLWEQLTYGIGIQESMRIRRSRSLHSHPVQYPIGRHWDTYNTNQFVIFNYGYSPMTPEFYGRKLQIQTRIPTVDKIRGMGTNHTYYGQGLTDDSLLKLYHEHKNMSKDLTIEMKYYIDLMRGVI